MIFFRSLPSIRDIRTCSSVASDILTMLFSSIIGGKFEQLAAVTMSLSSSFAMLPFVPVIVPAMATSALNMLSNCTAFGLLLQPPQTKTELK